METASPLKHHLPEAHSLPDGFVEISSDSSVNNQSRPEPAVLEKDNEKIEKIKDYKEMEQSPRSQDGVLIGLASNDSSQSNTHTSSIIKDAGSGVCIHVDAGSGGDTCRCGFTGAEGSGELSAIDTHKKSDCMGSQKNLKEIVETKRKVAKRSMKSEKELLEFTLKYQKVIAERDAAVSMRERLESLCRELQRQNKMLMDECHRVSTEGQNMRSDLSAKFSDAIKDINIKLEEQKDDCLTQLKENEMLRNKLKHLADQYALAEEQFSQKLKQKMLELQLADLKIQQHQERSSAEQTQVQLYAEQVAQLLQTEKNLRLQLAADGEKFQQFQDALLKSNEVFETFKQEMEKMSKSIKELRKENDFLKSKCENSDIALVKLVEERELMKQQFEKVKNQKDKLESLCRSLQAERKNITVGSKISESADGQAKVVSVEEDSCKDSIP